MYILRYLDSTTNDFVVVDEYQLFESCIVAALTIKKECYVVTLYGVCVGYINTAKKPDGSFYDHVEVFHNLEKKAYSLLNGQLLPIPF